jgi:uncharacterized protein (DUF58 family)
MYFPTERTEQQINKIEFAVMASAALMYLLKKQRDAVGLSVFTNELNLHTPCKTNAQHHQMLMYELYKLVTKKSEKQHTAAAKSIHVVADAIPKRSLVFIFSDMFDKNDEELFLAIQHLKHNRHEIVLFHTIDKNLELDFNFENRPYQFVDIETGEEIKLQPNQIKDYYIEKNKERNLYIKTKCMQYKIDLIEVDINQGYYPILMEYLIKRNKMKI